jgi:hypothetical protein
VINLLVVAIVAGGGYALYADHYAISDWYFLRSYHPPAAIAALATQADMTTKGRNLFYRADPQIITQRAVMVRYCNIKDNQVAELGCYLSTDQIYLLSITQPQLKNEMATTAGYETLHSVYQRMGNGQRRRVDAAIEQVATHITDPHILQQIKLYAQTEPGSRDDELFSVLGTEYPNIPASLDTIYAQYFANRSQLVDYYQQFNQTFDQLHTQITQQGQQIDATKATMQNYLASGDTTRYNSLVPSVNTLITTYNQEIDLYNQYAQDILGQESAAGAAQ